MNAIRPIIFLSSVFALASCGDLHQSDRANSAKVAPPIEARQQASSLRVGDEALARAYDLRESHITVEGEGIVIKVLRDDTDGSRHQRFILRLQSKQTLLVAHNIDISRRIDSLKPGDRVAFRGEYVWNAAGGVIHWTHPDPAGRHPSGWLKREGKTY